MSGKVLLPGLTTEQEQEIKNLSVPVLVQEFIQPLLTRWKISWHSFKRRANKSNIAIPFAYSWNEFVSEPRLHSKFNKNNLYIQCKCGKDYICIVHGFVRRKYQVPLCAACYKQQYSYDEQWRQNNSKAQLVAQNKPDVIAKQIALQKVRHSKPGMKEHYIQIGKTLWEDPRYRKKVIANSSIAMAGTYQDFSYQSSIELAFLMKALDEGMIIQNYCGSGIPYIFEGKEHRYFPDFVLNNQELIEVKGTGSIYNKHKTLCDVKHQALEKWCISNGLSCRIVFDAELPKSLIKKARVWHKENNGKNRSQNAVSLPG